MKFKNKRHLILSMKKKSGVALSDAEVKELLGIEGTEEKADPKKDEEAAKKPADDAAKEDAAKKPAPEKKDGDTDPNAAPAMSMEDLGKAIAQLNDNMNMIMEALSTMMEGQGDAPADDAAPTDEESKADPKKDEPKKEDGSEADAEDNEEEMSEEDMEKELEKTIAELESIENA